MLSIKKSFFLTICLVLFSVHCYAWNTLTRDIDLTCQQNDKRLDCEYRLASKNTLTSIEANTNNTKLAIETAPQYPQSDDTTAVLFLVDTSDPARQNVIKKNITHIKDIISSLKPHHKVGLASFDKSLKSLSAIGTSNLLLFKSLEALKASGKTTELYRNLLKAIEQLNAFKAQRKVIILLSDGQAEDKAYFHSDVIKMARENKIVINAIGYPRSISLSVALQTLRRLSEETGGAYIETDATYNIASYELKGLLNNIDNGSHFTVSLGELFKNKLPTNSITLSFFTKSGIKRIKAPVVINFEQRSGTQTVNVNRADVNEPSVITSTNTDNSAIQIISKQASPQPINLWLWYGLPAAFIIIIIFILITLFLLWREPKKQAVSSGTDYKPYAYLIAQDESETRYPITRTICRIGRSKDNELTLDDTSISRRHAEIHRNTDGTFNIIDMNSMNGVYINNEKIGKADLHEGDIVEIGDFFLHFTQLASDYSLEESTVMQKTRTPTH